MQLNRFVVALVVFALVVVTGVLMSADVSDTYNVSMNDSSFNDVNEDASDILDEMYETSDSQKDKLIGEDGDVEESSAWESMITGAYSAVRLLSGSFSLVGGVLTSVSQEIGIPSYFVTAAITVVAILISFAIIYLLFRFKS